jgi:hypothetical protein
MGVNNRKRRAAKQRKRARQRGHARQHPPIGGDHPFRADPGYDAAAAYAFVELQVIHCVRRLARRKTDDAQLFASAESLRRRIQPHPAHVLEAVLGDVLDRVATDVVAGGWGPDDLRQLVRRCAGERFLPTLAALLDEGARLRLDSIESQAAALRVAGLLSIAPRLAATDLLGTVSDAAVEHPKLARVRALLAKAESTDFDEEAEALSAKAHELITKYALERLVDHERDGGSPDLQVRRLWLDPPYVDAKAALVHEVATANRCRSAVADNLGFCLLVGAPDDLDAVELLVTSLLVQADAAMLRHGRRLDGVSRSRTRSFRRSFLFAYAGRIGERLRTATETITVSEPQDLLPVLRDHEEKVAEAFSEALPHTVEKQSTFSNWEGWAAGVAAADLAPLDVNGKLRERAG